MQTTRLLEQIRADFERLRWHQAIETQLVHKATNAEAEGVVGMPSPPQAIAFDAAGHREFYQRVDAAGNPTFREDPVVDVNGKPITNSAGEAFDVVMPASRTVTFCGDVGDYQLLSNIAERAGRLVATITDLPSLSFLNGWHFSAAQDLWWAVLFEMAWAHRHPLLIAVRQTWVPAENPTTFIPYDLELVRQLSAANSGPICSIPANWLKRLPEAYASELKNAAAASFDAADYLVSELQSPTGDVPIVSERDNTTDAKHRSAGVTMRRRFTVAFSFPGEQRALVEEIADSLASALGRERIFYDHYHQAELAVPNLDLLLQRIYAEDADLVVVFVCGEYNEKEWCGVEWRAIRELMKNHSRPDEDIMFVRLDDKPIKGLLSLDGFLPPSMRAREIADAIINRWSAKR